MSCFRQDIKSVLVLGAGAINIGQAGEFDYSGTQACKALKGAGYRVSLVNPNPATIMTDPDLVDATYLEPLTPEMIEKVISKERPDAILPTMGGQTALNCAVELYDSGVLERYGVCMIGADREVIRKAEDRKVFRALVEDLGLCVPKNISVSNRDSLEHAMKIIGLPAVIRSSYTLGGIGSGIAYNVNEFKAMALHGLEVSPVHEIQIDQSIVGWKEFELEVMRDSADNAVVICSIENIDPMGVHTGDSITVAPALTLRDSEYQAMRNAAIRIMRAVRLEAGGANVQFAVNPNEDESLYVIEMNPRVSRSSALASKATGFPVAKFAALLAVGYTLDKIKNDCAKIIPASFEPTMDYVVVKIPRFGFDKFPGNRELTTSMKSIGEVMSVGRSFCEALQKAICSTETGRDGFVEILPAGSSDGDVERALARPRPDRIFLIADAIRHGIELSRISKITRYDMWFLHSIELIVNAEKEVRAKGLPSTYFEMLELKKLGFSDSRLATLICNTEEFVASCRIRLGVKPVYKRIDTCAAEFPSDTEYMYACYESKNSHSDGCEAEVSGRDKVVILGGGPNRIGQGVEFDYTCVQAVYALKKMGYEAIMINCNPETVSTDYDIASRLYFSPVNAESVIDVLKKESESGTLVGVIVQFGGQTPLKLAKVIEGMGFRLLGTNFDAIDLAEDRMRFKALADSIGVLHVDSVTCYTKDEFKNAAKKLDFPILVRPSYVLGGQRMVIIYNAVDLGRYIDREDVFELGPVILDKFLSNAMELDVDAISDGDKTYVAGVMEHIEEAGVHSGDSACSMPAYKISQEIVDLVKDQTSKIASVLNVRGFLNVQYAVKDGVLYVLEVNPRASRTLPMVTKVTGIHLTHIAVQVMLGERLPDVASRAIPYFAVKEAVFPFSRFSNTDILLGPEMRSTGEVMGMDQVFALAYAKSQIGAGFPLPSGGRVLISVKDSDKQSTVQIAMDLLSMGFSLIATRGTAVFLQKTGVEVECVNKVREGRPHVVDMLCDGSISFVINTSEGEASIADSYGIRRAVLMNNIPYTTTIPGARALVAAMKALKRSPYGLSVKSLQEYYDSLE